MDPILLDLLILAVVLYLIARQFLEQEVTMRSLLALPILIGYYTYTRLQVTYGNFDHTLLAFSLLAGALVGLLPGLYHSSQTRVRQDQNGRIFAKPSLAASLLWLGILILRIGSIALSYTSYAQSLVLIGLVTTFISALFLSFVVVQKFRLFLAFSNAQGDQQSPIYQPHTRR